MGRRNRHKAPQSSSSLFKTLLTKAIALLKFAVGQIMLEILLAVSVIGFSYLFMSWGLALSVALIMAIGSTFVLLILTAYLFFGLNSLTKPKGEVKVAQRISQILTDKRSTEWNEYQDWLHDIMQDRQEMLAIKRPQWQVKLITYKRLSIFCIVVGISKVKQAVASMRRSR